MAEIVYDRPVYRYYPSALASNIVNAIIGVIQAFLALRLILVLFGASPSAAIVAWLYSVTGALIAPFAGAFPNIVLGGFVIETATILAMIGYAIIGWLIMRLLSFVFASSY